MRVVKCPMCGKGVDLAVSKVGCEMKSLLSGDRQTARCPGCGDFFLFALEGRAVVAEPAANLCG